MQIEAIGRLSIQFVATDRQVQPRRMGGMDAQLVGPAGFGIESDARPSLFISHDGITGNGRFAIGLVNHLSRAVQRVGTEWQAYHPL